jgi:hypothetical protein
MSNQFFTKESKSLLAKLMSEEDIQVRHAKVETAMFDVKNRILTLPQWKDMSEALYDLLVGHEVAHALFTPAGEKPLLAAVERSCHSFVNVIEDCRIEKLQKSRFLGLRTAFLKGYQELWEKDFFGCKDKLPWSLSLIDRINVYFKTQSALMLVENEWFNSEELHWVRRVEALETFDEVADLAEELYKEMKQKEEDKKESNSEEEESSEDDNSQMIDGYFGKSETSDNETDDESEETDDESNNSFSSDEIGEEDGSSNTPSDESDESDDTTEEENTQFSSNVDTDIDELNSSTEENLSDGLKDLVNNFAQETSEHYTIQTIKNLDHFVKDWKEVSEQIVVQLQEQDYVNIYDDFLTENKKTIGYLVKEFELKKAARASANASHHKSGNINASKLWSYQINEDIFQRKVVLPAGKNHGMVMLVDWSGSMSRNLYNTVKQTLTMAVFCRRIGIPFDVFTFNKNGGCTKTDGILTDEEQMELLNSFDEGSIIPDFSTRIRNVLSNRMNAQEFKNAANNWLRVAKIIDGGWGYSNLTYDELSMTPLNDSIILVDQYITKFKSVNKIEKVNLVVLTDGDDDGLCNQVKYCARTGYKYATSSLRNHLWGRRIQIIRDKTCNKIFTHQKELFTTQLIAHMREKHNMNAIGFMIVDHKREISYAIESYMEDCQQSMNVDYFEVKNNRSKLRKELRKEGYITSYQCGYNEYYILKISDTTTEELNVDSKMTKSAIRKSFMKHNNSKKTNRQMLNKFVELVK